LSGYTPVFDTVFSGSLYGRYPDTAAWLFFLAMADWQGHVDRTPEYIAGVTGMPLKALRGCIDRFTAPDPHSRSQAFEGRKLVLIDVSRAWGWKVVNIEVYRKKASDRNRTESGADAERKRVARASRPEVSHGVPRRPTASRHSDTDTDSKSKKPPTGVVRGVKVRKPSPASLIPTDFNADTDLTAYAVERLPGVDVSTFTAQFRDWATAQGREYVDWRAAFRTRVNNAMPGSGKAWAGEYPKAGAGGRVWE